MRHKGIVYLESFEGNPGAGGKAGITDAYFAAAPEWPIVQHRSLIKFRLICRQNHLEIGQAKIRDNISPKAADFTSVLIAAHQPDGVLIRRE